ncbi:MAG: alpha amylase C-terminal domain-containing protein, partial [Mariprofundaceae bacterium]
DLNRLYAATPALHEVDFEGSGFQWLSCDDAEHSVLAFLRRDKAGRCVLVALNATPTPRHGWRVGTPHGGRWREVFNSDAAEYGGGNLGNLGGVKAQPRPWMGEPFSMEITLPPLALVVFEPED